MVIIGPDVLVTNSTPPRAHVAASMATTSCWAVPVTNARFPRMFEGTYRDGETASFQLIHDRCNAPGKLRERRQHRHELVLDLLSHTGGAWPDHALHAAEDGCQRQQTPLRDYRFEAAALLGRRLAQWADEDSRAKLADGG